MLLCLLVFTYYNSSPFLSFTKSLKEALYEKLRHSFGFFLVTSEKIQVLAEIHKEKNKQTNKKLSDPRGKKNGRGKGQNEMIEG